MAERPIGFWDALRSWADSAGLLLPTPEPAARPTVPQAVCDSCPICQAAATLDQVNPQVITDMTEMARDLIAGMGSALASAGAQRTAGQDLDRPAPAEQEGWTDEWSDDVGSDLGAEAGADDDHAGDAAGGTRSEPEGTGGEPAGPDPDRAQ